MKYKNLWSNVRRLSFGALLDQLVHNDRGVALIFALVLMLVVAIMGASATMTSEVDLKVSGNTKVIRTSFYVADGGIQMTPKVISKIIADRALPSTTTDTPLLAYDTANLLGKIMGYIKLDDPSTDTSDIFMNQGTLGNLAVDITRTRTMYLSGGGVEFAAGTEGVGVGGAASTAVYYNLASTGTVGSAPKTTVAQVASQYRKVAGVAGGR